MEAFVKHEKPPLNISYMLMLGKINIFGHSGQIIDQFSVANLAQTLKKGASTHIKPFIGAYN